MDTTNKNQKNDLGNIPLNCILQDNRVKEYMQKKEQEIRKECRNYAQGYHSQITTCHAWLLTLHYAAISRLQEKYNLSKPEFLVLMGAYLLKRTHNNGFRIKKLSSTLLSWQYNKVYHHLQKLSTKGYIRIEKNMIFRFHEYWITQDGTRVIRAFSQHYWQIYWKVRKELGDLSRQSLSLLLNDDLFNDL